ncbi:hypothetical protein J6590_034767 [Homalodisca vitripennis]|nr:hypothetical protein J6590_034767 [Homalodisca vitripennis]
MYSSSGKPRPTCLRQLALQGCIISKIGRQGKKGAPMNICSMPFQFFFAKKQHKASDCLYVYMSESPTSSSSFITHRALPAPVSETSL